MEDEFNKIMHLFSLDQDNKEKQLDEIFHLSIAFIEKYKDIQTEGSSEEKADFTKKLSLLREKISDETAKSESALNLSKEEIKELSKNKENFTNEQWELLQKTKESIIKTKEASIKNAPAKSSLSNVNKNTKRGRSSWLKS
jgi:hypothetical protein